jgi:ATP-dependent DNA helicase DinG
MASSSQTWPALIATARGALWRAGDGTIERLPAAEAAGRAAGSLPLVCHAPAVAARLGLDDLRARDLLELFAFVRPARFCLPTRAPFWTSSRTWPPWPRPR